MQDAPAFADIGHITEESGLGAVIEWEKVPLSEAAQAAVQSEPDLIATVLTGGDDYELCFTAPADAVTGISGITSIGKVTDGRGVVCRHEGKIVDVDSSGYRHVL